jgi:hypothetical protein
MGPPRPPHPSRYRTTYEWVPRENNNSSNNDGGNGGNGDNGDNGGNGDNGDNGSNGGFWNPNWGLGAMFFLKM